MIQRTGRLGAHPLHFEGNGNRGCFFEGERNGYLVALLEGRDKAHDHQVRQLKLRGGSVILRARFILPEVAPEQRTFGRMRS